MLLMKRLTLGAKQLPEPPMNMRPLIEFVDLIPDCQDHPTKQIFRRCRKLVCIGNLHQELANFLMGV